MITTANIDLGTRFGGSVDVPFEITHVENDLQVALGRIRGTAVIDTAYTARIDDETYWQYRFVVDGTNQQVILDRLAVPDGADAGAFTEREVIDTEPIEPGAVVEEYERALAHLFRRTNETANDGLTTTHGDGILSAVYRRYAEYPDDEIATTDNVPFESYADIEDHFLQDEPRRLWRALTDIEQIGDARATKLILVTKATDPADLRDTLTDTQWEALTTELEPDP